MDAWAVSMYLTLKNANQKSRLTNQRSALPSFAYMEMSLILAKLIFAYDMELLDKTLDWEGQSHMHVQWWKPAMRLRFTPRMGIVVESR